MVVGERNWLLREPKARFVTPFPSLPRASLQTLARSPNDPCGVLFYVYRVPSE